MTQQWLAASICRILQHRCQCARNIIIIIRLDLVRLLQTSRGIYGLLFRRSVGAGWLIVVVQGNIHLVGRFRFGGYSCLRWVNIVCVCVCVVFGNWECGDRGSSCENGGKREIKEAAREKQTKR